MHLFFLHLSLSQFISSVNHAKYHTVIANDYFSFIPNRLGSALIDISHYVLLTYSREYDVLQWILFYEYNNSKIGKKYWPSEKGLKARK